MGPRMRAVLFGVEDGVVWEGLLELELPEFEGSESESLAFGLEGLGNDGRVEDEVPFEVGVVVVGVFVEVVLVVGTAMVVPRSLGSRLMLIVKVGKS